jgi:hypothetical protein
MNFFIIFLVLTPLTWRLLTNYKQGVYWVIFLLVALSSHPIIITGGSLPNFNLQRLILLVFMIAAIKNKRLFKTNKKVPFRWILIMYAAVNVLPLVFSIDFVFSLKVYLSFTIEIALFYTILISSIDTRQEARLVALSSAGALLTVAVFALIERYLHFNPVDAFMPGYIRKIEYVNDILSTFPHRILFGTAMAMGWPMAIAFSETGKKYRFLWRIGTWILLFACYFSFSRGPWLAAILAGSIMFIFASSRARLQNIIIVAIIAVGLVSRPGIWNTIMSSAKDTSDVNTLKGMSYQYRWELWGVAWDKISRSGERILFGFGQGASELMPFDAVLSYTGETTKLWSWDNHYAATMLETGIVGLILLSGLYTFFLVNIFKTRKFLNEEDNTVQASIVSAIMAMLFVMTNVAIFAPQLNYLLWSLITAGIRLGSPNLQENYNVRQTIG